ncbi:RcnB family protein [Sphingomonas radiodurans]|uniref:RcnB family protein n=1 Tax=Sphingomonas radiodurans TaxID=2890321 RepID=UPI001E3030FE|nr:RcnB family protein [Sphingomonas radiodurans]WBH16441.1 RcnB family protein [Sphingomonas radiodurans]
MAALLAAASIIPGVAVAQDRGERGERTAARAERMQQRQAQQAPAGDAQQRSAQRVERMQQRQAQMQQAPAAMSQQRAERMQQRQAQQMQQAPSAVAQQRAERMQQRQVRQAQQSPAFAGQPRLRDERRDDRAAFTAERQRDRQALQAGQATRDVYRADRSRDVQAYRQDRTQDRRVQVQRDLNRSAAELNNQRWRDYDRNGPRANSVWSGGRNNVGVARGGGWNRDWRRDSRYDWNRFRVSNRSAFQLPRYYAPYGWNQGYQRFGIGAVLSASLFSQNYWIDDPWSYRLPDAGDDLRWVRYYNDAILVDVYTGETVDVIHDIFW